MRALSRADVPVESSVPERICDAAMTCLGRRGVRKTTLDDVAAQAGCSRATVYRAFPGGKEVVLAAAVEREIDLVLIELSARLIDTHSLEDTLVVAITGAARAAAAHRALNHLLAHEPQVVLPYLSFEGLDLVLDRSVEFLAPWLARFTDPDRAREVAEWSARVACLYAEPSSPFDLTQPHETRRLVTTYLLAGAPPAVTDPRTRQESKQ